MADLYYFDGQWFKNEEEFHNYLEQRYQKYLEENDEYDQDWLRER
jgi:hypothetical protein